MAETKGEPIPEEREIRIDLPVRAFLPVGWVGQESLRLELYRRISMARDHQELATARAEAEDRFGRLPPEVETLLAVASLRVTAERFGVEEVTTFRRQVRIRPLALTDALALDVSERVPGAAWHRTTQTLNLDPPVMGGSELPAWVEGSLLAAMMPA